MAVNIGETGGFLFGRTRGLNDLVSAILSNAIIFAGVIMLFLLLFGGVSIIIGAGQDDPAKAAQGKKAATAAVIGFFIIFTTYWLIEILDFVFGGAITPS